jgi:hypothetical protein
MSQKKPGMLANLTWQKRIFFSIVTLLLSFFILELFFRAFFSFYVGPSILFYGTPFHRKQVGATPTSSSQAPETRPEAKTFWRRMTPDEWLKRRNVETHPNELEGYSKYFPNQKRIDFDVETGERFEVTINRRGFRGRNFSDRKDPGVIRVICLGASSTFGYFDRDNETYPVYLEQILNERYPGNIRFEVINLGIPHLTAANIYNLFLTEGVQLEPDIVTYYEGNNDSDPPSPWVNKSLIRVIFEKSTGIFLTAKFIDSMSRKYITSLYPSLSDKKITDISNNFIYRISRIYQECRKRGILFVCANQQRNSQTYDRAMLKSLTYQEEVERIQAKSLEAGGLQEPELAFLIHSVLMKKLKVWAKNNQIPFVDVIAKLDHDRDVLVSWVHLSPRGNRMVAEAFAEKILTYNWGQQTSAIIRAGNN